jgi:hypothetical protein
MRRRTNAVLAAPAGVLGPYVDVGYQLGRLVIQFSRDFLPMQSIARPQHEHTFSSSSKS